MVNQDCIIKNNLKKNEQIINKQNHYKYQKIKLQQYYVLNQSIK